MPKSIATRHMNRMFPFAFFDELSERLKDYTFYNPAFVLHKKMTLPKEKRKELYNAIRKQDIMQKMNEMNLIEVEPFGEVLTLELCFPTDKIDTVMYDNTNRSQMPLSILVAQLYDSSDQPVFSKDVTEETIERIPEVLWDDPNLMLAIVSFSNEDGTGAQIGVIKIPERMEAKFFEKADTTKNN